MSKTLRFSMQMAIATLISRVLGLLRDVLFAKEFGSSPEYDAYLVAILLPFILRRVFAEGALSTAFVPLYNKKCMISVERGKIFANSVMTVFIPVILMIIIACTYFMPQIVMLMAPGLTDNTRDLTVFLGRIIFPFIIFISLWAVYAGMLNSHDIYFTPALSPALHNIFIIIGIYMAPHFDPPILGPTIFFILGGAAQWFLVYVCSRKIGYRMSPTYEKDDLKEFFPIFFSSFAALSITQINSVVDTNVVSSLGSGSVSLLQYANRLFQLPLGVFAISVSTVALTQLSKKVGDEFKSHLMEGFERMLFFVLPATLGLIFMREDIIRILFQRGEFSTYDTIMTSEILLGYVIGLPFYSLYSLLAKAEYSLGKIKITFLASVVSVSVNVFLDFYLAPILGPLGIALATSIAGISGFAVLLIHLISLGRISMSRLNLKEFMKIFAGTASLTAVVILMNGFFEYSAIKVVIEILLSVAVYIISLYIFRQRDIVKILKRILKI